MWHKTQTIEELNDGSVILDFDVDGLSEINGWVMSFGYWGSGLEPKELRDEVIDEARKVSELY